MSQFEKEQGTSGCGRYLQSRLGSRYSVAMGTPRGGDTRAEGLRGAALGRGTQGMCKGPVVD